MSHEYSNADSKRVKAMTRRSGYPFHWCRFAGNRNTNEVHDLDSEKTNCQINEIILEHVVTFTPDTLREAYNSGYDKCEYCNGGSKW